MRLFFTSVLWWLFFGATALAAFWVRPPAVPEEFLPLSANALHVVLVIVLAASALFWLLVAVEGTLRWQRYARASLDPAYRQRMIDDLKSSSCRRKRRAVITVADFFHDPFGIFPWKLPTGLSDGQVETLATLHRAWLFPFEDEKRQTLRRLDGKQRAARAARVAGSSRSAGPDQPEPGSILENLWDKVAERWREALRGWINEEEPSSQPVSLPPLVPAEFIAEVRGSLESALGDLADAINAVADEEALAQTAEGLQQCFWKIEREALQVGLGKREEAAKTGITTEPVDQSEPSRTARRNAFQQLVGRVNTRLNQASEAFKNLLLDLGPSAMATYPLASLEPLPPLSRNDFIEAVRAKGEETLEHVADVINASPTGEIGVSGESLIHDLFTAFCWQALEVGLTMRLWAWEDLLPSRVRPRLSPGKVFPIRTAANPPLPPSQVSRLRRAQKFRRMKAAAPPSLIIPGLAHGTQNWPSPVTSSAPHSPRR